MADFITTVTRVTTELRRSNLTNEAKQAINDAIEEASENRFYFNEMTAITFNTAIGTEFYSDLGLVEIDAAYYVQGGTRYNMDVIPNMTIDERASGNTITGRPEEIGRVGGQLRFDPIPNVVVPVYLSGYGKLTPFPLVNNADTNAWLNDGERYVRALAKRNLLRDVVRDYGEARVLDAVAEDYKTVLESKTTLKHSTGLAYNG